MPLAGRRGPGSAGRLRTIARRNDARCQMAATSSSSPADQPFSDRTAYGNGPDDSITDATEDAAVTHHQTEIGGRTIAYTARAGHLVTVDPSSSRPQAKMFYVSFTADDAGQGTRPVTFF